MFIQNAVFKTIPTAGLTFPLAEGTVVTAGDVTGIVPQNITEAGPTAEIYVAVGGVIDLTSEANAGVTFTEAQINALGGDFNFIPAQEGGSSLPSYSSADIGKVLTVGEASPVEKEVVVVPEQSVKITSETMMPGVVVSADNTLQAGASFDVLIDTISYHAVAEASGSSVLVTVQIDETHRAAFRLREGDIYFAYMTEMGGVYSITPGDYTVSLSAVQSVTPSVQTVIVPEQSVTFSDGTGHISNVGDITDVQNGDAVYLKIGSVEASGTAEIVDSIGQLLIEAGSYGIGLSWTLTEPILLSAQFYDLSTTPEIGLSGTYTVSLSASVPSVEPKWEAASGGVTYVDIGNKTIAANSADYAIYVNGNELKTFAECKAYLEGIKDTDIRIRDGLGWQGISGLTIREDEGLQNATIYQQIGTNAIQFGYAHMDE